MFMGDGDKHRAILEENLWEAVKDFHLSVLNLQPEQQMSLEQSKFLC